MTDKYRIAIVGAASLRGKELKDTLTESSFVTADVILIDDEELAGQLDVAGDEATFIQRIEKDSFDHTDFVFFAGDAEVTEKHWQIAQASGASLIDLSYAMEKVPGVLIEAPWLAEAGEGAPQKQPDLRTPAVIPAHPVSLALALLTSRLTEIGNLRFAAATVLEPSTEYGRAAMDELHQQTVGLLSFQNMPKEVYDTQVAFTAAPAFGEEAKVNLGASEARIRRHYALLAGNRLPHVGIQLIHAPVFHGYNLSLAVEFDQPLLLEHVEAALGGDHLDLVLGDAEPPNNLTSAGQSDILVRARTQSGENAATKGFWIWASFDNLKVASLNAVACALDLRKMRPQGKVQ
ncbi:Asd/ArgC dimerization domain-containing protein [Silvibacterium acidisoli]|uniref:Asd/ArgC dimerization domain-containing protein n=1 Tax=Acidobacteriaceae bacterium ZG23-2 TaxID=2883246 RepID=UPI00406C5126